jgi:hypothetical protein
MNLKKKLLAFTVSIALLSTTLIASSIEEISNSVGTMSFSLPKELKMFPISMDKKNTLSNITASEVYGITLKGIEAEAIENVSNKIDIPSTTTTSSTYSITDDDLNTGLIDQSEMQILALPDLSILEFTYDTANYPFAAGGDAPLRYVLSNTGGVAANNVYVGIYFDGSFIGTQNLGNLSANYNYTISFELSGAPAGNHTIMLEADYYNNVAESNENNNKRSSAFSWVGMPDLVAEVLSDGDVNEIQAGDSLGYEFSIYNIGTGTAYGPFEVDLVMTNGIDTSTTTFEISNLPAGQGAGADFNVDFGFGSVGNVIVRADTTNTVAESNENNNRANHTCKLIYHIHNNEEFIADWVHSTEAHYGNGTPSLTRPSIEVSTAIANIYTNNELNAIRRWNNISSNIIIDNYVVSNAGTADLRITVGDSDDLPLNTLGLTVPVDNYTWTNMMLTDDPILLIPTTSEQRARTIAHEMGHALGLAHPDNNCPYPSIMFQSTQTNATFEITNADKYNIRHLFWE